MGTDIVTTACRHRLPVDRPLDLIHLIGKIYNADIKVVYYNLKFNKEPYFVTLMEHKIENPSEHLIIDMPQCNYLTTATLERKNDIEWDSEELSRQIMAEISSSHGYEITGFNDDSEIDIYQELVDIDTTCIRWYNFLNYFTTDMDKESSYYLYQYRRRLARHAHILGCSEVFYYPDQGIGEFILDRTRDRYEDFIKFVRERRFYDEYIKTEGGYGIEDKKLSVILNIPCFLKNKETPICPPRHIDVLWDDFSDLSL